MERTNTRTYSLCFCPGPDKRLQVQNKNNHICWISVTHIQLFLIHNNIIQGIEPPSVQDQRRTGLIHKLYRKAYQHRHGNSPKKHQLPAAVKNLRSVVVSRGRYASSANDLRPKHPATFLKYSQFKQLFAIAFILLK